MTVMWGVENPQAHVSDELGRSIVQMDGEDVRPMEHSLRHSM